MSITGSEITGLTAGVPFLALPPSSTPSTATPVVFAWHLMDPPRSEAAFASALPLVGLDAWKIYFGLPMFGSRLPEGGMEALFRDAVADVVLNVHDRVQRQVAAEFPAAYRELRDRFGFGDGPIGLMGGSAGAMAALIALTETDISVDALALVSPLIRLRPSVDALASSLGDGDYRWSPDSLAAAGRLDFVDRADDVVALGQPATLLVVGSEDLAEGFIEPARQFKDALSERYDDAEQVGFAMISGMGHTLAEEPGVEPAPQTEHAHEVDALVANWFARWLER